MDSTNNARQMGNMRLSVKNVLRGIAFFLIIFCFTPSFLVSCSGQEKSVNVMTAVTGVKVYEESVVDPVPFMLVCVLIPIAIIAITFVKKFIDRQKAMIIAGCTGIDLIIWIAFFVVTKKIAEDNMMNFKAKGWYFLNMIFLLAEIAISAMIVVGKLQMEADIIAAFSGGSSNTGAALSMMSNAVSQMSNAVTKMADNSANATGQEYAVIGYCAKCGSPLLDESRFCINCGEMIPEDVIEAAKQRAAEEAARREAEEQARREAEEAARREAEEQARREAEEAARREAEEQARREAEEQTRREAEAIRKKAEEQARREAEETTSVEPLVAAETIPQSSETPRRPAFCRNCGAKLPPDGLFCECCGTKI